MKVKVGKAIVKAFRQKAAKATAKGMKQVKPSSPKIAPTAAPSSANMIKTKGVPNKTYATRKQAKNAYNAKQDRLARDGFSGYTPNAKSTQNRYMNNLRNFLKS